MTGKRDGIGQRLARRRSIPEAEVEHSLVGDEDAIADHIR